MYLMIALARMYPGAAFAPKMYAVGVKSVMRPFLNAKVRVENAKRVEKLPLVLLVHALNLHVEDEIRRKQHALFRFDIARELFLFNALDLVEDGGVFVRNVFAQRGNTLEVKQIALPNAGVQKRAELGVAKPQPAALRNAVRFVLKALRENGRTSP